MSKIATDLNRTTFERVNELLRYDPDTGFLVWKKQRGGNTGAGCKAGNKRPNGYIYIKMDNQNFLSHRLAWLLYHGRFPKKDIDHINGVREDNRIINLRECTPAENQQNLAKLPTNTSGYIGVYRGHKPGKWYAQIEHRQKAYRLGTFNSRREAHEAYLKAKQRLHKFQPTIRET